MGGTLHCQQLLTLLIVCQNNVGKGLVLWNVVLVQRQIIGSFVKKEFPQISSGRIFSYNSEWVDMWQTTQRVSYGTHSQKDTLNPTLCTLSMCLWLSLLSLLLILIKPGYIEILVENIKKITKVSTECESQFWCYDVFCLADVCTEVSMLTSWPELSRSKAPKWSKNQHSPIPWGHSLGF